VGGGDGEGAELLVGELLAGAAQVVRLGEDALGDGDDRLAGSVIETRRLPWRTNTSIPSSSSSARICFDTPGWEVCSASAASETLRPRGRFR
jgi:hypothetical protein